MCCASSKELCSQVGIFEVILPALDDIDYPLAMVWINPIASSEPQANTQQFERPKEERLAVAREWVTAAEACQGRRTIFLQGMISHPAVDQITCRRKHRS